MGTLEYLLTCLPLLLPRVLGFFNVTVAQFDDIDG